jgi:hypothetical protein
MVHWQDFGRLRLDEKDSALRLTNWFPLKKVTSLSSVACGTSSWSFATFCGWLSRLNLIYADDTLEVSKPPPPGQAARGSTRHIMMARAPIQHEVDAVRVAAATAVPPAQWRDSEHTDRRRSFEFGGGGGGGGGGAGLNLKKPQ